MYVQHDKREEHAAKLKAGLARLGPSFVARLCYWCEGNTMRNFEHCSVCGRGRFYGSALGLLICNEPAPESVVNQVLVAAETEPSI
jgi:hypothetical protein